MKKSLIRIIVLALLLCVLPKSITVNAESADIDKFKKSVETVKESTEGLIDILSRDEDIKAIVDTFDSFSNVISLISTAGDTIGSIVSFLQLIGVIKGTNARLNDISIELNEINIKIDDMNKKLDDIITKMETMQASSEFKYRTTQATLMKKSWNDYVTFYEEPMSSYITDFNVLVKDGIRDWMETEERTSNPNKANTNKIVVWYKYENGKYVFNNTYANEFSNEKRSDALNPSAFVIYSDEYDAQNDKYLILGEEFLPATGEMQYNIDQYRERLINYVKTKINTNKGADDLSIFNAHNYTDDEIKGLTDEKAAEIAENVVDSLIYRITYNQINVSSSFADKAIDAFKNYCTHILNDQEGVDAMLKWLYLTHAFEFQTKDEIKMLLDSMILKVGTYGMFLVDTIFLSRAVSEADRNAIINRFSETIEKLSIAKKNAITGYDNYSYINNKVIYLGKIEFHANVNIDWSKRGSYASYRSCSDGAINHKITRDEVMFDMTENQLLGDVDAVVLAYTLASNGEVFDFNFMDKYLYHLKDHKVGNYDLVLTSLGGKKTITESTNLRMYSNHIIGSWFEGNPSFYMNNTPGSSSLEYFNIRNMVVGTIFDSKNAILNVDKPLLGIGVYGEDHGYWIKDESAAIYGATAPVHHSNNRRDVHTGSDFFLNDFYTTYFDAHAVYNCLLAKEEHSYTNNAIDPLRSFEEMLENYNEDVHEHKWSNQNVLKEETDVINYECENEQHLYSELENEDEVVELTFDLDGGVLNGSTEDFVALAKKNKKIILQPNPIKEGYEFVSWDNYKIGDEYLVNGPHTFKAVYKPSPLYYFVEGENLKMHADNISDAKYHIKRSNLDDETILRFESLNIDNKAVSLDECKIEEGSLVLTLNKDYIKNLSVGVHNVTFNFKDAQLITTLEIVKTGKRDVPPTGAK